MALKKTTVTVLCAESEHKAGIVGRQRDIAGFANPAVPGLAIHPSVVEGAGWAITHVASGLVVASVGSKAKAARALPALGKLLDWNRPAHEIIPAEPGEWRYLKQRIHLIAGTPEQSRPAACLSSIVRDAG